MAATMSEGIPPTESDNVSSLLAEDECKNNQESSIEKSVIEHFASNEKYPEGEETTKSEKSENGDDPVPMLNAAASKAAVKAKKKEDKSIDHILKALASLQTPEEKLAALCKKYTDLLEEHRVLQSKFKQTSRKLTSTSREKEQLQSEHSKAVLAKSKLESLCRELQRHNKLVKEESLARAREEEEKRKEVTCKFQTTINDIQQQMNDHHTKNTSLREENIELANKLKNLIEQYELREQHMEKLFKHKELEQQLVDAKLAQATLMMTEEKEKSLQEKQILLTEATEAHKKVEVLETQEKQLRAQVALYTEKYEDFQATLAKSNEVFGSFKSEMDKMTKKIKKLEKETNMWRQRWENSNRALLEMAEEKTRHDKESAVLQAKIQKLESLCRALQKERKKNSSDKEDSVDRDLKAATKTPPNTPDSSRASPEPVPSNEENPESSSQDTAPDVEPSNSALEETASETLNDVQVDKMLLKSEEVTACTKGAEEMKVNKENVSEVDSENPEVVGEIPECKNSLSENTDNESIDNVK